MSDINNVFPDAVLTSTLMRMRDLAEKGDLKGALAVVKRGMASFKPESEEAYLCRENMGLVLMQMGRYGKARVHLKAVMDWLEPRQGFDATRTLEVAEVLGLAMNRSGDHDGGKALLVRVLGALKAAEEPDPLRIAMANLYIADCHYARGEPEEAGRLYLQAWKSLEPDSSDLVDPDTGEIAEPSEMEFRDPETGEVVDPDDVMIVQLSAEYLNGAGAALYGLGNAFMELGDPWTARTYFRKGRDLTRKFFGEGDWNVMHTLAALAEADLAAGDALLALDEFEEAFPETEGRLGPGSDVTVAVVSGLCTSLVEAGRAVEAVRRLKELHAERLGALGREHFATISCAADLASALKAAGKDEDSLALLRETHRMATTYVGWFDKMTMRIEADLGEALFDAGETRKGWKMTSGVAERASAMKGYGWRALAVRVREQVSRMRSRRHPPEGAGKPGGSPGKGVSGKPGAPGSSPGRRPAALPGPGGRVPPWLERDESDPSSMSALDIFYKIANDIPGFWDPTSWGDTAGGGLGSGGPGTKGRRGRGGRGPKAGSGKAGPGKAAPGKAGGPEAGPGKAGGPEAGSGKAGRPEAGPGKAGGPEAGPGKAGGPEAGSGKAGGPKAGSGKAARPEAGSGKAGGPEAGSGKAGRPEAGPVTVGGPDASPGKAGGPKAASGTDWRGPKASPGAGGSPGGPVFSFVGGNSSPAPEGTPESVWADFDKVGRMLYATRKIMGKDHPDTLALKKRVEELRARGQRPPD
jgi:tetratricopeptide (TPR) repeat protein